MGVGSRFQREAALVDQGAESTRIGQLRNAPQNAPVPIPSGSAQHRQKHEYGMQ
jgi:hypothetical protein